MPSEPQQAPERGPRILFVSGGSALRPACRILKRHTHNSIHLVTPFDSGGSSALLRATFGILSVGDLRNRLIALADENVRGSPEIYELFSHRFDPTGEARALGRRLAAMIAGEEDLVAAVPEPLRHSVKTQLQCFAEHMPGDFDLRGASIGNLILVGGYLEESDFEAVISRFSQLLAVRGTVRPVVDRNLHLAVRLEDGSRVVGQHRITGKECPPLPSPVRELELVSSLTRPQHVEAAASENILELIRGADLICYPIGSFFSSVLCNLLPAGIGHAIASARCPKVYVPNTAHDPEQNGIDVVRASEMLLATLRRDAGTEAETSDLLNFVLIDSRSDAYALEPTIEGIRRLGAEPVEVDFVSTRQPPEIDPGRLTEILLSLCPESVEAVTRR